LISNGYVFFGFNLFCVFPVDGCEITEISDSHLKTLFIGWRNFPVSEVLAVWVLKMSRHFKACDGAESIGLERVDQLAAAAPNS